MFQATGVILAGGKSKRMGTDKAFLDVGREAMIRRVAEELAKLFAELLICGGEEETGKRLGLRVITDLIKGGGPLSGIHAALHGAKYGQSLVVACDMPFVSAPLAQYMIRQAEGYDVAVPRHGIHLQPLFAVYSKSCSKVVEESLHAGRYKIIDLYPRVRVNYVNEENLRAIANIDTAFFNINTPAELARAREMAGKEEKNQENGFAEDFLSQSVCSVDPGSPARHAEE